MDTNKKWIEWGMIIIIILIVSLGYVILKIDRKLTCIYNTLTATMFITANLDPSIQNQELFNNIKSQAEKSCNRNYIFSGKLE